jgi:hypothetical protein
MITEKRWNPSYDAAWQDEQIKLAIEYFKDMLSTCRTAEEFDRIESNIEKLDSKLRKSYYFGESADSFG